MKEEFVLSNYIQNKLLHSSGNLPVKYVREFIKKVKADIILMLYDDIEKRDKLIEYLNELAGGDLL